MSDTQLSNLIAIDPFLFLTINDKKIVKNQFTNLHEARSFHKTHIQAVRCKGLYTSVLLGKFCFYDKRAMHGSTRHFPSSCVDNEFHNGAAEIPMPSWCQGMKTKGQYTKDGETQKDKEWVLNDTEGQLHQQ